MPDEREDQRSDGDDGAGAVHRVFHPGAVRVGDEEAAEARAAERNPVKARNIALIVAAIGAGLGGFLIANANSPWVKDAMNGDGAGAVLVMLPAVAGPIVAIAALILALVWHLRARNRR